MEETEFFSERCSGNANTEAIADLQKTFYAMDPENLTACCVITMSQEKREITVDLIADGVEILKMLEAFLKTVERLGNE